MINKKETGRLLADHVAGWQDFIDTMSYPVCIIDNDCRIVAVNSSMSDFFKDAGELINRKCHTLFHSKSEPIFNCPVKNTSGSIQSGELEIYEPSLKKHLRIMTSPIIIEGQVAGILHSALDITEQKKSESESGEIIEIYATSINELKSREVKAQKGRDAFLNMLEDISESYKELEDLFMKLILVMVNALDAKSPWTKGHSERVSRYAEAIAKEMLIDEDEIKEIRLAGLLHDIGKIGTYDYLLDKPGKLTRDEFDIVKKHPEQGADILKGIKQLRDIIPYIKYHHEKLDGKGYPNELKGDSIPLGARILHVADSFDSMTSDRPYRPAPGIEYALSELNKFRGTQFDHKVVEAFLKVLEKDNSTISITS